LYKGIANIFDHLPALSAPKTAELRDELERYLSTDPEHVIDVLKWWSERKNMFPCLSQMALDYLSIPGEALTFQYHLY
jgi:hAT family C-terminal dimerisation region